MTECTEFYVYEIQPDLVEEFLTVKDQLITETEQLPGLVRSATLRSTDRENLFIDRMVWESADAAAAGNERFQQLPIAERFMAMMAGPPQVGGGFSLIAGR